MTNSIFVHAQNVNVAFSPFRLLARSLACSPCANSSVYQHNGMTIPNRSIRKPFLRIHFQITANGFIVVVFRLFFRKNCLITQFVVT